MIFNTIDLSDYGLTVRKSSLSPFMPLIRTNHVEIADKAYDFRSYLSPRIINLDTLVTGTSKANLISNLDNISKLLNPVEGIKHLTLDFPDDRFYKAKLQSSIDWEIVTHKLAQAELSFICPDPLGYGSEISHTYDLGVENPATETTGGTAYIEPVYTLTAEEVLDGLIKVECVETGEELQWTGALTIGQKLEINVATWLVKKEGDASMATVTGQFPRLLPDTANRIEITGFGAAGALNIVYRNTFT